MMTLENINNSKYIADKKLSTEDLLNNSKIDKIDYIPTNMPVLRFLYKLTTQNYLR